MQGLTHVHVHLLAADAKERETIRADILECVETPLNYSAGTHGAVTGMMRMTPGGPVRWLGGRQQAHRATQLGLEFILPQANHVRRAG